MKNIIFYSVIFLVFSLLIFGGNWFLNYYNNLNISYKIHFLIFILAFIVVMTLLVCNEVGFADKIGFIFLGFVVFKMFAMGYVAIFQQGFKENVIGYFVLYWLYLGLETGILVSLLKKQDINHKNK